MALVYFLLVLSVLVLIHEAGHYIAARIFGVKADEFGYGFPPRLIGFVKDKGVWKRVGRKDETKYTNTIWSINWLPLGGFVRIKGEQPGEEAGVDSFHNKPIWQRVIILAAGVCMNWVLATILLAVVFSLGTTTALEDLPAGAHIQDRSIRITQIVTGSPADKAGLQPNDAVIAIDGKKPETSEEARALIALEGEKTFSMTVLRNNEQKILMATPAFIAEANRVALGIGIVDVGHVSLPVPSAIKAAVLTTAGYTKTIVFTFGGLIRDAVSRRPLSQDLTGPVGIAVMTGQIAQQGIVPLLQFAAVLSINLAVVNFLPIPALDGGRVLFLAIEKLRRKPMSRTLEASIHNIAFLALLLLVAVISIRDLSKYGGMILRGVVGLVQ